MRVLNKTNYDTRYLRKLFLECEKHSFEIFLQRSKPRSRRVTVVYHRTGWVGGYASINGTFITIKLPRNYTGCRNKRLPQWVKNEMQKPPRDESEARRQEQLKTKPEIKPLPAREVASVYLHELAHNLGKRHKNMANGGYTFYKVDWWPDEPVPLKVARAVGEKLEQNIIELRAIKAQKKLAEWQSKLKRAKTYVVKYSQKVKYYEKKMAAIKVSR